VRVLAAACGVVYITPREREDGKVLLQKSTWSSAGTGSFTRLCCHSH
jgi:hypothetical protein